MDPVNPNNLKPDTILVWDFTTSPVSFKYRTYFYGNNSDYYRYEPSGLMSNISYVDETKKMRFITSTTVCDSNIKPIPGLRISPFIWSNDALDYKVIPFETQSGLHFFYHIFMPVTNSPNGWDSIFYFKTKLDSKGYPVLVQSRKYLTKFGDWNFGLGKNVKPKYSASQWSPMGITKIRDTAWLSIVPDSNALYSYRITADSICTVPVISNYPAKSFYNTNFIKFNNKGDKLYFGDLKRSQNSQFKISEYNFDFKTGKLIDVPNFMFPHSILENDDSTFFSGWAISPNDSNLFVMTNFMSNFQVKSNKNRIKLIKCNVLKKQSKIIFQWHPSNLLVNIGAATNGKIYFVADTIGIIGQSSRARNYKIFEISNPNSFFTPTKLKMIYRERRFSFYRNRDNLSEFTMAKY